MPLAVRIVAVGGDPVEARAKQDGEEEARQRQRRDQRDHRLDGHRLIP